MNRMPGRWVGACAAVFGVATLAIPGLSQATGATVKIYSYAVKFVCEEENGNDVDTSVNIHNPSLHQNADFFLKLVVPDYGFYIIDHRYLGPDNATSLDCDIFDQPPPGTVINPTDFEGFIVVISKKVLDVVGLYEVEHSNGTDETEDVDVVAVQPQIATYPVSVWNSLGVPN